MSATNEATTIDSLQIEIHSNSTNAAAGIDALAVSLGKLKQNGSIGVAVKNLNNLSKALKEFTPVADNSKKISRLADAVTKLSNAGSIAKNINQLTKLPSALKGLDKMELDGLDSKFERIASASSKLSGIKTSGLSSMVNSLGKLGDVTKSLDDDTINDFANKVAKLTDKLAPLSAKMTSVSSGFRTINTNANKASTGVQNLGSRVNITTLNMATMITTIQGVVSALRPIINLLAGAVGEAIEWDGIASRFGRGFGEQAEDVYSWIQKLNKEMDINVQQFMQYSSTYATMLTGFGLSSKDASNMALGYMELTYDIWAGYNDIYKSLDDAAMAVRSAIAGEVEPIRKAGLTVTEATLKETAARHGLAASLEEASEAQKSYLRYLALTDAAYAQNLVGSYARELNTAEGQMRTFRQQLKSLSQSFGSLFLPILVKIMPYLQAFVDLLGEAIIAVAKFFGIEIQKVDFSSVGDNLGNIADSADKVTGSLGDTSDAIDDTTKAIKDLKNATIGIDELNVISPPSSSASNNGAGGWGEGWGDGSGDSGILGNIDSLWDESIFDGIQTQVDDIKEKIKDMLPAIGIIGGAFAAWRLAKLLTDIDDVFFKLKNLDPTVKGLAKGLTLAAITVAVGALVWDFTGAYLQGGDEKDLLKALGTTVLGTALAAFLAGKVGAGLVLATSGVVTLTRLGVEISKGNVEWTDPESIITAFVGIVETAIGGALTWKVIGPTVKSAVTTLCGKVGTWLAGGGLATITSAIPYVAIVAAIVGLITLAFVDYDFTEVSRKVGEKVGQALKWAFDNLTPLGLAIKLGKFLMEELDVDSIWGVIQFIFTPEAWKEVIIPKITDIIGAIAKWIGEKLSNLAGNIKEIQDGFLEGLGSVFDVDLSKALDFLTINDISDLLAHLTIPTMLFNAFKGLGEQILSGLWEGVKERWPDFGEWVEGLFDDFVGFCKSLLGIAGDGISSVFKSIGGFIVDGLIGGIKSKASELWEATKSWCGDLVDTVKKFFGIASPSKEFKEIGRYCVEGLVNGFSVKDALLTPIKTIWNNAKTWWETKKGNFSTYVPSIGDIKSKISSAWNSARTWYNSKKSAMSTYTPNIGSIYEKVKERWDNARTWYNSKKSKFSEYTPSIGSIYEKVKARWDNAREWYNKKKSAMSTYTPSIGSIKDKLVSAWNTAKSWWNKNVRLSIPSLSFKVTYTTKGLGAVKKAIVNALNLPGWPTLSFAKNGGIFDAGSLIWAGEAGAEIVANAGGGKTGVMNVDQMKEAVYEGVYAAVVAAMKATNGNGGEQAVNVYLDSKQITSSVERRQRERGASIMGNQVYSY